VNTKKSAGDIVESLCTRCRKVMNHTIVAMVGEKIVRVECNTCKGTHNYHPVKAAREPAAGKAPQQKGAATRKSKADPEAAAREEWAELRPFMNPVQALPYDMNGTYRVKNLLQHPVFGLGVVQLLLPPNKMDVLFRDGKKRLRCG
jgi:hypothetical protein